MNRKNSWGNVVTGVCLAGIVGLLSACGTAAPAEETALPEITMVAETAENTLVESLTESLTERLLETTEETIEETIEEPIEETVEETPENALVSGVPRLPTGHQIVYSDGEIYGWTRYEYDETGRKKMNIFIAPNGNEYWSPVFYDGNGHVIPENVGGYSVLDDNGLYLEVGMEDNRGRRTPMVEYEYDDKGNLTDYWYMYSGGKYMRHVVYSYDSQDRLIREDVYHASRNRLESYIEYIYDGHGHLIRKNEAEDASRTNHIVYTLYQYDEQERLIREEKIWGGCTHDYVDYYYNDNGELIREYHFLEDKMMGGPYTVEYVFEAIKDSVG